MEEKPLVLFFPFDLLSHYTRCLEIARMLEDDFLILFQSSDKFDGFVKAEGFKAFDCVGFDAEKVMECAKNFDFSWLNSKDIEKIFLRQVEVIRRLEPAIVIGDMSSTLKMAAEYSNTPFVSILNAYMTGHYKFCRDVPPSHPGSKYLKKLPGKITMSILRIAESAAMAQVEKPFNKIRVKYGLKRKFNLP